MCVRKHTPPAHNGPRRMGDRPSAPAAGTRRRLKAAHTQNMFDTDAVFHAPMFALNADADANACEPNRTRSTPTEGARTVRRRCAGHQTHTRSCACARKWTHTSTPTWGTHASAICSSM
jgi:hypothetical protein